MKRKCWSAKIFTLLFSVAFSSAIQAIPSSISVYNGFVAVPFNKPAAANKRLIIHVVHKIAIWLRSVNERVEFKAANLFVAITLYTTVAWPFLKGDRYIQV